MGFEARSRASRRVIRAVDGPEQAREAVRSWIRRNYGPGTGSAVVGPIGVESFGGGAAGWTVIGVARIEWEEGVPIRDAVCVRVEEESFLELDRLGSLGPKNDSNYSEEGIFTPGLQEFLLDEREIGWLASRLGSS